MKNLKKRYHQAMTGYTTGEPIYALATPYAPSALAVVRTSGEKCIEMIAPLFSRKKKLLASESNSLLHGFMQDREGNRIDEVVLSVYRASHGYTKEEAVEITMHGSLPAIARLSRALESVGFRQALKGEFTYRAFMNGSMDLTEAEAVEEIVSAKTENAQKDALDRLTGSLSSALVDIKERILNILASLEVYLDYAEDEIIDEWSYPKSEVEDIIEKLERIVSTYSSSRLYQDGAMVVLAGAANAGKSSLFNTLLKENRAIVSSVPGTTRDYIEASVMINGIFCRLYDTAGLRDTEEEIESEGIKRSLSLIDKADLILYITDGSDASLPQETDRVKVIFSKSDISKKEGLSFSSITGEGIKDVTALISRCLLCGRKRDESVPSINSERQKEDLERCIAILKESMGMTGTSEDIMALCFQSALSSLDGLLGTVTTDDVLDRLFSSFCLGK